MSELSIRVRRAENILGRRLLRARRWHNRDLVGGGSLNDSFAEVYTSLFKELRPNEGEPNMACVGELISEGLFKDRRDAILAMYPAYDKKIL